MVSLATVRASNQRLKTAIPGITALFVGGTTGIGQSTLRQLAIHAERPKVYIIGRSEEKAGPFLAELGRLNPKGSFRFIETDVSLIRNVDKACKMIKDNEDRLNMLFMTPGGISLSGRKETCEGIDQILALRYYSRMRFIQNLLPLLSTAMPARVISIFGGGFESSIKTSDLDLKHNFSILNCAKHAVTMTSLSLEHLASSTACHEQPQHQEQQNNHGPVSFMHIYPGLVRSNLYTNSFPTPIAAFYNYVLWPTMMWPFSVDAQESGERHLFHLTSACYPGGKGGSGGTVTSNQQGDGVSLPGGPSDMAVAIGSTGLRGTGSYLLNWKGDGAPGSKIMQRYREEGMPETVWRHTIDLLDKAASREIME